MDGYITAIYMQCYTIETVETVVCTHIQTYTVEVQMLCAVVWIALPSLSHQCCACYLACLQPTLLIAQPPQTIQVTPTHEDTSCSCYFHLRETAELQVTLAAPQATD